MFSYVGPNAWSWSMINERQQHFGKEWFFNSIFTIRFVCGYKCGKWPIKNIFSSIRMKFRARISSPSILMAWKFVRNRQNMLRAWMKLLMSITHVSETLAILAWIVRKNTMKIENFIDFIFLRRCFIQIIVGVRNETDFTIDASGETKQSRSDLLVPFCTVYITWFFFFRFYILRIKNHIPSLLYLRCAHDTLAWMLWSKDVKFNFQ